MEGLSPVYCTFTVRDDGMTDKKYVHIYQCKPGDIIAEDIFDRYGFLLTPRNEVISRQVIERLKTFRVRQLSIYESEIKKKTEK